MQSFVGERTVASAMNRVTASHHFVLFYPCFSYPIPVCSHERIGILFAIFHQSMDLHVYSGIVVP